MLFRAHTLSSVFLRNLLLSHPGYPRCSTDTLCCSSPHRVPKPYVGVHAHILAQLHLFLLCALCTCTGQDIFTALNQAVTQVSMLLEGAVHRRATCQHCQTQGVSQTLSSSMSPSAGSSSAVDTLMRVQSGFIPTTIARTRSPTVNRPCARSSYRQERRRYPCADRCKGRNPFAPAAPPRAGAVVGEGTDVPQHSSAASGMLAENMQKAISKSAKGSPVQLNPRSRT